MNKDAMQKDLARIYKHIDSWVRERGGRCRDKAPRLLTPVTFTKWAVSWNEMSFGGRKGACHTIYIYLDSKGWRY